MSRPPEVPDYEHGFFVDGKTVELTNKDKFAMFVAASLITAIAVLSSGDNKRDTYQAIPFQIKPNYEELTIQMQNSEQTTPQIKLVPDRIQPLGGGLWRRR